MNTSSAYALAREQYQALGVDTEVALNALSGIPISLHCWQGDDVGGFEKAGAQLGNGLAVTGNYPGKARTPDELRADLEKALSIIPGKHRLNLHACYADLGGKKGRTLRVHRRQFPSLDRLVQIPRTRIRFQPDLFCASIG